MFDKVKYFVAASIFILIISYPTYSYALPKPDSIKCTVNSYETNVELVVNGASYDEATSVLFPTWSDNGGQDDIRWYSATKQSTGQWSATISVSNHADWGKYSVHAYATINNTLKFVMDSSFYITKPSGVISVSQSQSQTQTGEFTATVSSIKSPSGVQNLFIPVWSDADGQDDIDWVKASVSGQNWTATMSAVGSNRRDGLYRCHAYLQAINGIFVCVATASKDISVAPSNMKASLNYAQTDCSITATGGILAAASEVLFPVWSDNGGQDDIRWYKASRLTSGTWSYNLSIRNHCDYGNYIVHMYAFINGSLVFVGATNFNVSTPSAGVSISVNDSRDSIIVSISRIISASDVDCVLVPTWTISGGQDDIVWHKASIQSDGSYRLTIPASSHNGQDGQYICHVYVKAGNGLLAFVGSGVATLSLSNYVFATGLSSDTTRYVYIKNPRYAGEIYIPTWSSDLGQDDIVWYKAAHMGENLWRSSVDTYRLKHSGSVVSHVYADGKFCGDTSFTVDQSAIMPPVFRLMSERVQFLDSGTDLLVATDTDNFVTGVFKGSKGNWRFIKRFPCSVGAPWSGTLKGTYSVGMRMYSFGHGYTCYWATQYCGDYLYHSIKYNQGTFDIQDSRMQQRVSEGCIRLWIEDAKWIYDNVGRGSRVYVY